VVERCAEHGVLALPGIITPTEVMAALDAGVDVVKFLPATATSGGAAAAAVAALTAPFAGVRFVPTGGITAADVGDHLALLSVLAVGGSWTVPRDLVRAGASPPSPSSSPPRWPPLPRAPRGEPAGAAPGPGAPLTEQQAESLPGLIRPAPAAGVAGRTDATR